MSLKDFTVALYFRQIESLTLSKLVEAITTAADHGLELYFTIKLDPVPREDLERVIMKKKCLRYEDGSWAVGFPASPTHLKLRISDITADKITARDNQFRIGALLDMLFRDERHLIEPYAQALLPLARQLYPIIQPKLGWIDEPWHCDFDFREIDRLKLPRLTWVTFFSPAYVKRYGEALLRGIPAYRIEPLSDGGLYVQLTRNLLAESQGEMRRIRRSVRDYFAAKGLKVKCCAPYYIPKAIIPSGIEPVDPELHRYMRGIMGSTLVLTDGTRLKVLQIPWDAMNTTEKAVAITYIRNLLYDEMKEHPGARWRVEINVMPEDLAWMLEALAKKQEVALTWEETG